MTVQSQHSPRPWTGAACIAGAVLALTVFWSIGAEYLDWFNLQLGSTTIMAAGYTYFLVFWVLLGSIAAVLFGCAFAMIADADWARETYQQLRATPDRHLIVAFSAIAFVLPALIRWRLLEGADLTDDESVYRFSSELLLSGRLYAKSPPMKLFFDHVFMINDGKFYSQYFMGWPALLAPGLAAGAPGLMNPAYSALTVPAVFLTLREMAGRRSAVIGVMLYLAAPMLQFTAATQLSHTSCLFALAWMAYFVVRVHGGASSWWVHFGTATAFSVAFFIRPATAFAMGFPLLVVWAIAVLRTGTRQRWVAIASFGAPALLFGAAFLAVNAVQNGSVTYVSYQRAGDYARDNGFHFSAWSALPADWTPSFGFGTVDVALARTGVALTRINFALFGWPCGFVFLPFAPWGKHRTWILWVMAMGFAFVHSYLRSAGIDTFGPVHYTEFALPIIMLTALGVSRLTDALRSMRSSPFATRLPLALCFGLVAAAGFGYVPPRAYALHEVSDVIARPVAASREIEGPAIVFTKRPFIPRLCTVTGHFRFAHDVNDPDFRNPILWVNHISIEHDRKFMERYPDRAALVMLWNKDCQPGFVPLAVAEELGLPDGKTGSAAPIPSPEEMQ
ncbi:MAG: hypothetical protein WCF10_14715 [Polyangiales bacterium]